MPSEHSYWHGLARICTNTANMCAHIQHPMRPVHMLVPLICTLKFRRVHRPLLRRGIPSRLHKCPMRRWHTLAQ